MALALLMLFIIGALAFHLWFAWLRGGASGCIMMALALAGLVLLKFLYLHAPRMAN